jgi:hypothetical protein
MYLVYTLSTLLFILVSIAGVTVISHKYIEDIAVARSAGLLVVILALFFIEHFIGLGRLHWLFPFTVITGTWLLWKEKYRAGNLEYWHAEFVFVLAFLYGFFWRYSFPDISPSSENITDLFFISNYYPGDRLPPIDNWNPPQVFNYYYAFQHYAAALLGRVFNLEIGVCYNISSALIAALPLSLAWSLSGYYIQRTGFRLLLVCTLALGGTGISPILHIAYKSPEITNLTNNNAQLEYRHNIQNYSFNNIISSARLIGSGMDNQRKSDPRVVRTVADVVLPVTERADGKPLMVLPLENFGYQFFLGDYHPPSGGFYLLLLAIALIILVENNKQPRTSQALLTLLVPVMMITNTWTFPLLVLLIIGWLIFRLFNKQPIDWIALFAGGVAGSFLIYPFLFGFTANSLATPLKFVTSGMHTPISRFLAMHWPILLVLFFGFFEKKYRRLSLSLSVTWLCLLVLSEFVYVDDPTADKYERTNSVMKWWGWIQTGVVVSLGAMCLGSSVKWVRWATFAVFMTINIIAIDLARYWLYSDKPNQGKLAGHHWYTQDPTNRMMFEFLKASPKGVVLESIISNALSNTSIYGIFNDKPVLLGWPLHLATWHGVTPRVWILKDEIDAFYKGEKADSLEWLAGNKVKYIVFNPTDNNNKFDAINNLIKSEYQWHEFNHSRQRHTGIWVNLNNTGIY